MVNPLHRIRSVPGVGVLAERRMGGFLALSALVGIGVGLGAAALVFGLEAVERLLHPLLGGLDQTEDGIFQPGRLWIFVTVPLGLLAAWWVARRFAPEVAGDGVPEATAALVVHGGRIRWRVAPLKVVATSVTAGSGGSAGREGPIVQIGASVGSWIARRFNLGEDEVRSLVAAGAGAGIGASFNAPIAGMLFALEVILSSFSARHMSSVVVASVAAAITTQTIVGEELALSAGSYQMESFAELVPYAAMAIVIVVAGFLFLRLLDGLEGFAHDRDQRLSWARPVTAGLIVAGLIFLEPRLFGTGQEVTNGLLLQEQVTALTGGGGQVWWVLLLLALGKAVATSFTISSGASGGAFMPSLFMGAAIGTGFARLFEPIWWGETPLAPGAFAVVGMAAMFAVVGRAPLTAILIVFEVTGARDYELIVPLMVAATLGTFLAERFHPESVYTQALRRRGITVQRAGELDVLEAVDVGASMTRDPVTVSPEDLLADVHRDLQARRSHGVPVVRDGELVGIVTVSDMTRWDKSLAVTTVSEVMTPRPVTVTPSTPVSTALERMSALGVGRLPVVDDVSPGTLVGMFGREDAVKAYHEGLTARTDRQLHRSRLAQRTDPGAGYYDFRIPPGSMADGRQVREVTWPEGSTLVSIRRSRRVIVPNGDTRLLADDVVTAFGTESSKRRMIERLNAGADEPTAEIALEDLGVVEGLEDYPN